ncbi:Nitroreductase [Spironucleus salmonicida]|uniref:Nitroreductase n=1 Tax=Spironucleus salmonicida TaxID=348837 RepID=V6LKN4_9EUKA|nr:Nitroreductase [Spironucleus salmonicida]|eukprot:EST45137.1 Nitroreductase [Spironucleus salmonicida]
MPIYLNIDNCTGCSSCETACSKEALIMINNKPVLNSDECVLCGHCFAICPTGCFSLLGYESENLQMDVNNIIDAIVMRRTIRHFKQESVDQDLLYKIINISRYAPSASNKRPVKFLVIGRSTMQQLLPVIVNQLQLTSNDNTYLVYRNAPHCIITYASMDLKYPPEQDAAIYLTQIELYAQKYGLGTFWAGRVSNGLQQQGAQILGLQGMSILSCMGIGYPNIKFARPAARQDVGNVIWID